MPEPTLLVLNDPAAPSLALLDQLPDHVRIVAGLDAGFLDASVAGAEVIFAGLGAGPRPPSRRKRAA